MLSHRYATHRPCLLVDDLHWLHQLFDELHLPGSDSVVEVPILDVLVERVACGWSGVGWVILACPTSILDAQRARSRSVWADPLGE